MSETTETPVEVAEMIDGAIAAVSEGVELLINLVGELDTGDDETTRAGHLLKAMMVVDAVTVPLMVLGMTDEHQTDAQRQQGWDIAAKFSNVLIEAGITDTPCNVPEKFRNETINS